MRLVVGKHRGPASLTRILALTLVVLFGAGGIPGAGATGSAPVYSLERCITEALEKNRDLEVSRLDLDVARKQVREAWGGILPSVDASASYTRNLTASEMFIPRAFFDTSASPDDRIAVKFTGDNLWNASVDFDQPLFQAQVFIGIGAAERFKRLKEEQHRATRQMVATEVRLAYYGLLLAQENVRLTEDSLRRVAETLEETRALNRVGLASDYDVLRLEVEYGNLEPNLRRAENGLAAARRQLLISMGRDVEEGVEVLGSLRSMDPVEGASNDESNVSILDLRGVTVKGEEDLDRLLEVAHRERSDLKLARLNSSLARTQLSVERADLFPRLSAFASYGLSAQEDGSLDFFGESASDRTSNWQAGIRLELPLFSGGQRYSRISQRRLAVRQRETEERLSAEKAEDDIRSRLDALLEARERAGAQEHAVLQARRGFEIASAEYREGMGSQLQVTDAEVALRASEFNYAQAVYDVLLEQAGLDAAVGVVPMVDTEER